MGGNTKNRLIFEDFRRHISCYYSLIIYGESSLLLTNKYIGEKMLLLQVTGVIYY